MPPLSSLAAAASFGAIFNSVWRTTDGVAWTKLPPAPWAPRYAHALALHPPTGALVLTGGTQSLAALACAEVWVSPASALGSAWTFAGNASWPPRSFHSAAVLPASGQLAVIGGWTLSALPSPPGYQYDYYADVWALDGGALAAAAAEVRAAEGAAA